MSEPIDELVTAVLSSAKYCHIDPGLVRRIGLRELAVRPNLKAAVKSAKSSLHQIGGAFIDRPIDYAGSLDLLERAATPEELRDASRQIMAEHTSTRERLPILDTFFAQTLAGLTPVRSVIDIACGLNPLAIPWMPMQEGVRYEAYDIYGDLISFLNDAFPLLRVNGRAEVRDVAADPPGQTADLVLVLKTLPCLETLDKQAPALLLDAIQSPNLLISFPAHSLGGRRKGMVSHYESRFMALVDERGWAAERFEFSSELAFLVRK